MKNIFSLNIYKQLIKNQYGVLCNIYTSNFNKSAISHMNFPDRIDIEYHKETNSLTIKPHPTHGEYRISYNKDKTIYKIQIGKLFRKYGITPTFGRFEMCPLPDGGLTIFNFM